MATRRLTMAQALVLCLTRQYTERDGREHRFLPGCFGIFGHGNVAGVGQALQQFPELRYYQSRNEQAMVHAAAAFAKHRNRLQTLACTTSIGPGATNMVTAAAGATINRVPVLLLPGDIFARRNVAPVLQQLELPSSQDVSVNDCFRPVSRYWDRINRPDQLVTALPEALRVLTSPTETGAVTLCLPQDVQTEAWDYPEELFEKRVWRIPRNRPDREAVREAAAWIRRSRAPLIVAGGGVHYSEAWEALKRMAERTGIPVVETQAGKGALPYDHPQALGAVGVTGTPGANILAREADLVIGLGTRYSDFTTASKSAFQNPEVGFVNLNVTELDAFKHAALPLVGDCRAGLEELVEALGDWRVSDEVRARARSHAQEWDRKVEEFHRATAPEGLAQSAVIGAVNRLSGARDVVVCAAGSLPGDLHKLWRTRDPRGYHLEYGYSCMGYEVAGGLGVKLADPGREVYVMVGDGSWLMMAQEVVTSVQEAIKLIVVLLDNAGFASIGGLSESVGSGGFGTRYRYRNPATGQLDGDLLPVDLAANARSLGAHTLTADSLEGLETALAEARRSHRTTVVVVPVHRETRVGGFESWWDVPVAEVSEMPTVQAAREAYEQARRSQRHYLGEHPRQEANR
ncbi:MAG: 3D-(3,5/4)-trihydroxycyclohexane-1,2-dione acylhydrolase (decyclizing) [Candidatus Eremiobacterota bacterium]